MASFICTAKRLKRGLPAVLTRGGSFSLRGFSGAGASLSAIAVVAAGIAKSAAAAGNEDDDDDDPEAVVVIVSTHIAYPFLRTSVISAPLCAVRWAKFKKTGLNNAFSSAFGPYYV